jgi:predicted nucleic acid-binding protein
VTLVDTSVWVDHLRRGDALLRAALEVGDVATHPFVIGELACGSLRRREEVLRLLAALPRTRVATHEEAMALIDAHALGGAGVGWVDVHLLAASRLSRVRLWTRDRRLQAVADRLGVAQA